MEAVKGLESQYASNATKKELMLKKLLESQETYIQELEFKNKDFKDQLMQLSTGNTNQSVIVDNFKSLDLEFMKQPSVSAADKIQHIQDYCPPNSMLFQGLIQIKSQISMETQLLKEEFSYKENLLKKSQESLRKEKQQQIEEFEQIDFQLRNQIRNMEQENRILKDLSFQSAGVQKEHDMKRKMLEEIDQLIMNNRREQDELKNMNHALKLQLDKVLNSLEDQVSENETLKAKYERMLAEKDINHERQKKILEKMLKDTKKQLDIKQEQQEQQTQLLQQQQLQSSKRSTKELTSQSTRKDEQNSLKENNSQSKIDLLKISSSQKILNTQLKNAQSEIQQYKDQISNLETQLKDSKKAWDQTMLLINMEKKNLNDMLSKLRKSSDERENQLQKDISELRKSNKELQQFGEMREKMLQEELIQIRSELRKIQANFNSREEQHLKERNAFQLELAEYQQLVDQIHATIEGQKPGDHHSEIKLFQQHIDNLQKQLAEANELLGRNLNSSTQKIYLTQLTNKFDQYIIEASGRQKDLISQLDQLFTLQKQDFAKLVQDKQENNSQLAENYQSMIQTLQQIIANQFINDEKDEIISKIKEENHKKTLELEHAKRNLINYINTVKTLEQAIQPRHPSQQQNTQIIALNNEISRLNEENQSLLGQKNQIQEYYQLELENMWKYVQNLQQEKQDLLRNIESLTIYSNQLNHNIETQQNQFAESFGLHQQALQTLQTLTGTQFLDFEKLRQSEIAIVSEQYNQVLSRESSQKSLNKSQANNNAWVKERQLMMEEMNIMKNLINSYIKGYVNIMDIRNREYQLLQSERDELVKIENELKEFIIENKKIQNVLDDYKQYHTGDFTGTLSAPGNE